MKILYISLSFIFLLTILSSCGSNQKLQEKAPAQLGSAYFTENRKSLKLFIPVRAIQENRVSLDSIYFRGQKAELRQDPEIDGVYSAELDSGSRNFVLSSDPRDEYENKMPVVPAEIPFELNEDEAVIVFTENNKVKFYKIRGIKRQTPQ